MTFHFKHYSKCVLFALVLGVIAVTILQTLQNMTEHEVSPNSAYANTNETSRKRNTLRFQNKDRRINAGDELTFTYEMKGHTFTSKGVDKLFTAQVQTSLVFNFSKIVTHEAAMRFVDPLRGNIFYTNSPAIIWHEGCLVLVARIWLDNEIYSLENKKRPGNTFQDNWFYTAKFDRNLEPVAAGSILGIPTKHDGGFVGLGPIEPRLFKVNGKLYVSFNSASKFGEYLWMDYTFIWDYEENRPIIPKFDIGYPMLINRSNDVMPRDKHWMAIERDGIENFRFVRDLDPLRIMDCSLEGKCHFIKNNWPQDFSFNDYRFHLRGGTPFEQYKDDYYISLAHVTLFRTPVFSRYYTFNLLLLHTNPYRIVYISDAIELHKQIYSQTPIVRYEWIKDGFFFPVGLIVETPNVIAISGHVNDHSSVVIRLRGIQRLLEDIIHYEDKKEDKAGPPPYFCHDYIWGREHNRTGLNFTFE